MATSSSGSISFPTPPPTPTVIPWLSYNCVASGSTVFAIMEGSRIFSVNAADLSGRRSTIQPSPIPNVIWDQNAISNRLVVMCCTGSAHVHPEDLGSSNQALRCTVGVCLIELFRITNMDDRSKDQSDHTSDSSTDHSDHIHDPDYSVRWSEMLMKQKQFTSYDEYKSKKTEMKLEEGIGSSSKTPGRGRNRGRPQELQRVKAPRKTRAKTSRTSSSTSRRKKALKATILSWLIDSKAIQESAKVCCMDEAGEKGIKEGEIAREGILCCCCNEVFAVMDFEVHAGSNLKRPYERIFIAETRASLLSCMIEAWNQPEESKNHKFNLIEAPGEASDSYDDACIICADGGNLMCCEECNSTYHQACMGMEELPQNSWYCPYCACKYCGESSHEHSFLLTCSQCEKRYHWECFHDREQMVIDINSEPLPFCGNSCREVHEKLGKMVGVENQIDEEITWTLLRQMDRQFGVHVDDLYHRTECHSKLAVAWRVMEDCFETIIDRHTGINVIQSVVYNCGLAEMPFIATSENYRCKGMCAKLMTAIESTLCYLKVQNLIIPSTEERIGKWIHSYGFRKTEAEAMEDIMQFNTLMFHDSVRLTKTLCSTVAREPNAEINEAVDDQVEDDQIGVSGTKNSENVNRFDLNLEPEPEES
ncbi:increased DNA methylation 1-like [Cornus florida]|uniref:increased DNA methylation 1-like n=1 Tax=Cornus florida TaxID=4283 RepID=UPI00289D0AA2|nr:increased DNA methylation 1-like [Cornus florida]